MNGYSEPDMNVLIIAAGIWLLAASLNGIP